MDPTWGTCLEQSLCKMDPRRLKMKTICLLLFLEVGHFLMSWNWKIKKKQFLVRFFLKKLICRGSPEVTFCSWMKFQRAYGRWVSSKNGPNKNLIIPAADGQLEKSNPGCSDMDSGHSPDIKCASLASRLPFIWYNICILIGILPKIPGKYIKNPHSYPRMGRVIYIYIYKPLTHIT